jgi:hypothetical protein
VAVGAFRNALAAGCEVEVAGVCENGLEDDENGPLDTAVDAFDAAFPFAMSIRLGWTLTPSSM